MLRWTEVVLECRKCSEHSVFDEDTMALHSKQKAKVSVAGREHGSFSADKVG